MKSLQKTTSPPPKCPRIATQKLPRRSARAARLRCGLRRARVSPPVQLIHPGVVVCLNQEVPEHPFPALAVNSKCVKPRIPRVIAPLAPLDNLELPAFNAFGSTSPVSSVGRSADDGGIPRTVNPHGAAVVPLLFLSPLCVERAAKATRAITGEPFPPTEPPQRITVCDRSPPSLTEVENELNAAFGFPELQGMNSLALLVDDLPRACPTGDQKMVAKPARPSVRPRSRSPLVEANTGSGGLRAETGGEGGRDGDHHLASLASQSASPTVGWTLSMQEVMEDQQGVLLQSPVTAPTALFVPSAPEPVLAAVACSPTVVNAPRKCPLLKKGIVEAAKHALEECDAKLAGGFLATTELPPPFERRTCESIGIHHLQHFGSRLQPATKESPPSRTPSASRKSSCRWVRVTSPSPDQKGCELDERPDKPLWRDGSTAPETAGPGPLFPELVWRDSTEDLRVTRKKDAFPCYPPVIEPEERLLYPAATPRQGAGEPVLVRSVSPLRALLQQKREKRSERGPTERKDKPTPPPLRGKGSVGKPVPTCYHRPVARMEVWKEATEGDWKAPWEPWRVAVDPSRDGTTVAVHMSRDVTTRRDGVACHHQAEREKTTRGIGPSAVPLPLFRRGEHEEPVGERGGPLRRRDCQPPGVFYNVKMPVGEVRAGGLRLRWKRGHPERHGSLKRAALLSSSSAKRSGWQQVESPPDESALPRGIILGCVREATHGATPEKRIGATVDASNCHPETHSEEPSLRSLRARHTRRLTVPTNGGRTESRPAHAESIVEHDGNSRSLPLVKRRHDRGLSARERRLDGLTISDFRDAKARGSVRRVPTQAPEVAWQSLLVGIERALNMSDLPLGSMAVERSPPRYQLPPNL